MVRVRLSDLDSEVRNFLARAERGETIVVEDDNGAAKYGVTPYVQASSCEKQEALAALNRLQERLSPAMADAGVTEAQVDAELQN